MAIDFNEKMNKQNDMLGHYGKYIKQAFQDMEI